MDATAFCSNHVWKRWFWPQKLSITHPRSGKLGKLCGRQEQPIVNRVYACMKFEYFMHDESPLLFSQTDWKPRVYTIIYKQKDEPPPVAPTDLYWKNNSIEITSPGSSKTVSKRSCVCHPFTYGPFATACALSTFGGDNGTVVVRRPHGGRTITCHYLQLLCDLTNRRQVFEHVQNLVLNLYVHLWLT